MRKEYVFSKSKRNTYAKQLKQQGTIFLDKQVVSYFKKMASDTGVPYQVLINLFLKECAREKKRLVFSKEKSAKKSVA